MSSTGSKGLEGIVAAKTYLSDVRGDVGVLIYRGYDINELAGNVGYEETVFLLHHGCLPNVSELQELKPSWLATENCPKVIDLMTSLLKETVPMNALRTGISALGCFGRGCRQQRAGTIAGKGSENHCSNSRHHSLFSSPSSGQTSGRITR